MSVESDSQERDVVSVLPEHRLTREFISDKIANTDVFTGVMVVPQETPVQCMVLELPDTFVVTVFDDRSDVWRKLTTYPVEEFNRPEMIRKATQERAQWWKEIGKLP